MKNLFGYAAANLNVLFLFLFLVLPGRPAQVRGQGEEEKDILGDAIRRALERGDESSPERGHRPLPDASYPLHDAFIATATSHNGLDSKVLTLSEIESFLDCFSASDEAAGADLKRRFRNDIKSIVTQARVRTLLR